MINSSLKEIYLAGRDSGTHAKNQSLVEGYCENQVFLTKLVNNVEISLINISLSREFGMRLLLHFSYMVQFLD